MEETRVSRFQASFFAGTLAGASGMQINVQYYTYFVASLCEFIQGFLLATLSIPSRCCTVFHTSFATRVVV